MQDETRDLLVSLATMLAYTVLVASVSFYGGIYRASAQSSQFSSNDILRSSQLTGILLTKTFGTANSFATNATSIIKCYNVATHSLMNCTALRRILLNTSRNNTAYYIWNSSDNNGWSP